MGRKRRTNDGLGDTSYFGGQSSLDQTVRPGTCAAGNETALFSDFSIVSERANKTRDGTGGDRSGRVEFMFKRSSHKPSSIVPQSTREQPSNKDLFFRRPRKSVPVASKANHEGELQEAN